MNKLTIITNNVPREILCWEDLTDAEREEFDYLATEDAQQGAQFFRYKGEVHALDNFMRTPDNTTMRLDYGTDFTSWDGVSADSYFSGVLVRYSPLETDYIIVGRYYC